MPGRLKLVVAMFAHGGLTVLRKIRKLGYNVFAQRPRLLGRDGVGIVARSLASLVTARAVDDA
jgi:hypothetical protein